MPNETASGVIPEPFPQRQRTTDIREICQKLQECGSEEVYVVALQKVVCLRSFALISWVNQHSVEMASGKPGNVKSKILKGMDFSSDKRSTGNRVRIQYVTDLGVVLFWRSSWIHTHLDAPDKNNRCFRKKLATGETRKINGFSLALIKTDPMTFLWIEGLRLRAVSKSA